MSLPNRGAFVLTDHPGMDRRICLLSKFFEREKASKVIEETFEKTEERLFGDRIRKLGRAVSRNRQAGTDERSEHEEEHSDSSF